MNAAEEGDEEIIGGERVQVRRSAVKTIPSMVILESKLYIGTERSFLISLTKQVRVEYVFHCTHHAHKALYFSRPDSKGVNQGFFFSSLHWH